MKVGVQIYAFLGTSILETRDAGEKKTGPVGRNTFQECTIRGQFHKKRVKKTRCHYGEPPKEMREGKDWFLERLRRQSG